MGEDTPSDLIHVLEAMDADMQGDSLNNEGEGEGDRDTTIDNEERKKEREANKGLRKLPDWMRDPKEVAEEQVQHALDLQAKKRSFREAALSAYGIDEQESYTDSLSRWIELEHPVLKGRVVCFDLETTGFGGDDSIIEIGAVELIDGYRTGSLFQSYAKPRGRIHPMAQAAHEITESMLQHAPPIQIVMASFLDWVGSSTLVAHNLSFDLRLLNQELDRLGTLDEMSASFGVDRMVRRQVHGALVDSEILAQCYSRLVRL